MMLRRARGRPHCLERWPSSSISRWLLDDEEQFQRKHVEGILWIMGPCTFAVERTLDVSRHSKVKSVEPRPRSQHWEGVGESAKIEAAA
jgi:hypothetical protein